MAERGEAFDEYFDEIKDLDEADMARRMAIKPPPQGELAGV